MARFASGRDERADARVAQVAATAMSLAYSQRGAAACIAELRTIADAATLRAARTRLLEHAVRDERLLERARLLLGDAAWQAEVTR